MTAATIADTVGLQRETLECRDGYWYAGYIAPDDLGKLKVYTTYAARITNAGGCMVRFGVDVRTGCVEVVFTEAGR